MEYKIHHRDECRLCKSKTLKPYIEFERMPFTDEFVSGGRFDTEFRAPIKVFWCANCRSSQTLHDVEVAEYYREYRYTVSSSPFARKFMQRLAEETVKRFQLRPGDRVIEIGSGDGYQLSCYQKFGARVLGFEPSSELTRAATAGGVPTVQLLFNSENIRQIPGNMQPAQVVLLTYTFDHLPEPAPFLDLVAKVLDRERGLLIIEVHDLAKILERREICLFEHEHSIYLTALTMQRLLARAGFKLLCTDLVPEKERRGNSLLIVAALQSSQSLAPTFTPSAEDLKMEEWSAFEVFGGQVRAGIDRFRTYLEQKKKDGVRIAGYGAGGRGVMFSAMAGITSTEMAYLCDLNSSFYNLFTPVSHIPVVSPEHIEREPVDEIVVFSYAYMAEIREQLRLFLSRGGKLISVLDLIQ